MHSAEAPQKDFQCAYQIVFVMYSHIAVMLPPVEIIGDTC